MSLVERLKWMLAGYLAVVAGSVLIITQGTQYFWSRQSPYAKHIGSPVLAGVGIAVLVVGVTLLVNGFWRTPVSKGD